MNITDNLPLPTTEPTASNASDSTPASHKLVIAFEPRPQFGVPVTKVGELHAGSNAPHDTKVPLNVLLAAAIPRFHRHWGINE